MIDLRHCLFHRIVALLRSNWGILSKLWPSVHYRECVPPSRQRRRDVQSVSRCLFPTVCFSSFIMWAQSRKRLRQRRGRGSDIFGEQTWISAAVQLSMLVSRRWTLHRMLLLSSCTVIWYIRFCLGISKGVVPSPVQALRVPRLIRAGLVILNGTAQTEL